MRSSKLLPAVAVAATLLALAPAGAAARRIGAPKKAPSGPCRVHLEVPRAPITAGESVTLFGSLKCPHEAAAGRQVAVYQRAANRPGFVLVGTVMTEGNGAFSLTPASFTVNTVFYALSAGAKSAHRTVKVAPLVTPTPPTPVDGTQLVTGGGRASSRASNRVTFAGKVSPAAAGAAVVLQRENASASEEWNRIDVGSVSGNGEYSITHTFVVPGEANIRVVVHPRNRLNVSGASTPVSYEISQAQNPALTIESTVDPVLYGHQVTIKGIVKGAAANTPLTLLAHTRGGQFAPIATGSTTSGGAYEFTQTPLQNTAYKVAAASTSSAVLFEGVKYALSVAPVPSSALTGQPITFSGTVLPALVGHVVYLERQGAAQLGWHVVDVGVVTAPASPAEPAPFSIVHAFYTPGTARLRIKVPGDPRNQGIASPAFELSLTPAPASTLLPESPSNSRLPAAGQL